MSLLVEYGRLSLRDLGRLLVCETSDSPSRLVDRLVASGLVVKAPSDLDRRGVILNLTGKGRKTYFEFVEPVEKSIRSQIQGSLSSVDLKQLHTLLWKFGKANGAVEALIARRSWGSALK